MGCASSGAGANPILRPPTRGDCAAQVRIFTPRKEMPFAGHPTIGTAFVLLDEGIVPFKARDLLLEENIGPVAVRVDAGARPMLECPVTLSGSPRANKSTAAFHKKRRRPIGEPLCRLASSCAMRCRPRAVRPESSSRGRTCRRTMPAAAPRQAQAAFGEYSTVRIAFADYTSRGPLPGWCGPFKVAASK